MNYWLAETCNLGECVAPLMAMVNDLTKRRARRQDALGAAAGSRITTPTCGAPRRD